MYDGRTINYLNGKISEFKFSKTDFNISRFSTNTMTHQKTQENSTTELLQCVFIIKNLKIIINNKVKSLINNCSLQNIENIYEELYSRLIKPLYITLLISISLLFILKSKNDHTFKSSKIKIYTFGFLFIIFLESSTKFISTNLIQNLLLSILPFLFLLTIYFYFLINLRVKKT